MILTELFFIIGYFLVYGSYINFHVDFSCIIAAKLGLLTSLTITSAMASSRSSSRICFCNHTYALAAYLGVYSHNRKSPYISCCPFVFNALIPIHLCIAYRTLHNSRKQVRPFIFPLLTCSYFLRSKRNLPHKAVSAVLFNTERFLTEADNLCAAVLTAMSAVSSSLPSLCLCHCPLPAYF